MSAASREIGSRALGAAAILAALLLLVGFAVFGGVGVLQANRLQIDAQKTQLDALQRRRGATPETQAVEAKIAINPYLPQENFTLAANALQERIVNLIEDADGRLVSVGVDPQATGEDEAARRVSVNVAAELTDSGLQRVLYGLETESPLLFVIRLTAIRPVGRSEGSGTAPEQEPKLTVSMGVTGYLRKGGP